MTWHPLYIDGASMDTIKP